MLRILASLLTSSTSVNIAAALGAVETVAFAAARLPLETLAVAGGLCGGIVAVFRVEVFAAFGAGAGAGIGNSLTTDLGLGSGSGSGCTPRAACFLAAAVGWDLATAVLSLFLAPVLGTRSLRSARIASSRMPWLAASFGER